MVDADVWERTRNPWTMLQDVSRQRLTALAADPAFMKELQALLAARHRYRSETGWYGQTQPKSVLKRVAYFSMEFGLDEALPLYAGGLGILAGDYLTTASDLGVPAVGVGLLYQVGYFRQMLDAEGRQQAMYPYNDPSSLHIEPVQARSGGWLQVSLPLPGRTIALRVWRARVGRTSLYLLDSNDPINSPADRGITDELYDSGAEVRLMQESAYLVGFGTDHGTVAAASDWDAPLEIKDVRPAHAESYERLCHDAGVPAFLLPFRYPAREAVREELLTPRLERAIGVIYRPESELASHYFQASLPAQFDEYVWFDRTGAVTPLGRVPTAGMPETYPFGV